MKILILSDLHLDYRKYNFPQIEENLYDCVILAGDIMAPPAKTVEWAEQIFKKPVFYIAGNHEFYGGFDILKTGFINNDDSNVHFLHRKTKPFILNRVRFIGCTLWTDFNLYNCPEECMSYANRIMNDYCSISYDGSYFSPELSRLEHYKDLDYLKECFNDKSNEYDKTVLITHHAPHPKSITIQWQGDKLNPAFISNLENFIFETQPNLIVHGHIHQSIDYNVGNTRIISNPKGYSNENVNFNPSLIVEI